MLALGVFAAGHVAVAVGSSFSLLLAARFLTAIATGAFWAVARGLVGVGAMLVIVVGVPLGAFAGQLMGWPGPFWALAALAAAAVPLIARTVPYDGPAQHTGSVRSEPAAWGWSRRPAPPPPGASLPRTPKSRRC
ncbi:putative MFS family arabinose efflux permease [Streptomyces sp. SAI-170]|uniref:hypothetical protein n=1 Tax=Streptomyces sp. SAI-170 TaxID=3377729 RepID=UPI003C7C91BC